MKRGREVEVVSYLSNDETVFLIRDTLALTIKALIVTVHINGTMTKFLVDAGTSVNILAGIDDDNMLLSKQHTEPVLFAI